MTQPPTRIRFSAKLLRPASKGERETWSFLILPLEASAELPTRGMTTVEGTLNGSAFVATLEHDGQKSHWLTLLIKTFGTSEVIEGS